MMTCPRRVEMGMDDETSPFRNAGKNLDEYREDNCCSYCGSLNPDTLMERLEKGDITVGPTDKGYKIYVENKGGEPLGRSCNKFYFQHLSQEQRTRFIEIYNAHRMSLDYPGYFYVTPFFCRRGDS